MKSRWARLFLAAILVSLIFLSRTLFAERVASSGATQVYQYKCVSMDQDLFRPQTVQAALDQAASEGWRLVSASNYSYTLPNAGTPGGVATRVTTVLIFEKK